jgi:membrane carboxypeptidase/penicillin-binding protein PbpC
MNKVTKTIVSAAIAALAVMPALPTTGQVQDVESATSIQARRERRNAVLESLIDAQQKCYDQTMASVQAGQQKKPLECPVLDEMIAQTPLETLVGQHMRGVEARAPSEEILKLKRAIVDAAYFGYQRGKWKNAKY